MSSQDSIIDILKICRFAAQGEAGKYSLLLPGKKGEGVNPITISNWSIDVQGGKWTICDVNLDIDRAKFARNLTKALRDKYGEGINVEVLGGKKNEQLVFVEFVRPKTNPSEPISVTDKFVPEKLSYGFSTFRISFNTDFKALNVQVYDFAKVGYCPNDFFILASNYVSESLMLPKACQNYRRLLEQRYDFFSVCTNALAQLVSQDAVQKLLKYYLKQTYLNVSMRFNRMADAWIFNASTSGEIEKDVVAPILEVLEERELSDLFNDIDTCLIEGKYQRAKAIISEKLRTSPDSLFLLRRMGVLSFLEDKLAGDEVVAAGLQREPLDKLFLSVALEGAFRAGDSKGVLKFASKIVEEVLKTVQVGAEINAVQRVVPEILGDHWFYIDYAKAEAGYIRALLNNDESPRILSKLALLSKHYGREQEEVGYLERLAKVERRNWERSFVYYRLSKISLPKDQEKAIQLAFKAIQHQADSIEICLYLAETLVNAQRAREAVQALSETLDAIPDTAADKKSILQLAIGKIWKYSLGRDDLAKERFAKAVNLVRSEANKLRKLRDEFEKLGEREFVTEVTTETFVVALKEKNLRVIDDCVKYYTEHPEVTLGNTASEAIVVHMLDKPTSLTKVESWDFGSKDDWERIYEGSKQKFASNPDNRDLGAINIFLGKIALRKLNDRSRAGSHFLAAGKTGRVEQGIYDTVKNDIHGPEKERVFEEFVTAQLGFADEADKPRILKDLLTDGKRVDPKKLDVYAHKVYVMSGDMQYLKDRMAHYQSLDDLKSIYELLMFIVAGPNRGSSNLVWFKEAFQRIAATTKSNQKRDFLERIAEKILENPELDDSFLTYMISELNALGQSKVTKIGIKKLLERGLVPEMKSGAIEEILQGDGDLLRFFENRYGSAVSPKDREQWGKKLADLYIETHAEQAKICSILLDIGMYSGLTTDHLAALMQNSTSDNWLDVAKVLEFQRKVQKDGEGGRQITTYLMEVYHSKLQNYSSAFGVKLENLEKLRNDPGGFFDLFEYAATYCGKHEISKACTLCISNERCWEDFEKIEPVISCAIKELVNEEYLHVAILNKLHESTVIEPEKLVQYLRELHNIDIHSAKSAWYVFKHFCDADNIPEVEEAVVLILRGQEMQGAARQALAAVREELNGRGKEPMLMDVINGIFEREAHNVLSQNAVLELKLTLGEILIQRGVNIGKAIRILEDVADERKDVRALHALYLAYRKQNNEAKQVTTLEELIPLVKADGQLHRTYQLAQLENVYQNLAKRAEVAFQAKVVPIGNRKEEAVTASPVQVEQAAGAEGFPPKRVDLKETVTKRPQAHENTGPSVDWRDAVSKLSVDVRSIAQVIADDKISAVEKHVAVQAMSLIAGDLTHIKTWQHPVWRDFSTKFYELKADNRIPKNKVHPLLKSDLCSLLIMVSPIVVKYFRRSFKMDVFMQEKGITPKSKKDLNWNDRVFEMLGLKAYRAAIESRKYKITDVGGIGETLFFDAYRNVLFFDKQLYLARPNSHLFHRLLFILRSSFLGYYPYFHLNTDNQIAPFLEQWSENAKAGNLHKFLNAGSGYQFMSKASLNQLAAAFAKVGTIRKMDVVVLIEAMRSHIYKLDVAETLDVVGACEAIQNDDFYKDDSHGLDRLKDASQVVALLDFVTKLVLTE
ncbi:MAG: tetratricopeptide repeat protein [Oligoflexales bacterium]